MFALPAVTKPPSNADVCDLLETGGKFVFQLSFKVAKQKRKIIYDVSVLYFVIQFFGLQYFSFIEYLRWLTTYR